MTILYTTVNILTYMDNVKTLNYTVATATDATRLLIARQQKPRPR